MSFRPVKRYPAAPVGAWGRPEWECSRLPFPLSLEEKAPWKSSVGVLAIAFSLSLSRKGLFQSSPRKPWRSWWEYSRLPFDPCLSWKRQFRGQNSGLRCLFSLPAEEKALQSVGSFQEPARRIKNPLPVDDKASPIGPERTREVPRGLTKLTN